MRAFVVGLLTFVALPASIQAQGKERVYILADSLGWVLSLRVDPLTDVGTCEVATRLQPGARASRFQNGIVYFSVQLGDPIAMMPAMLESLTVRLDNASPVARKADRAEIVQNTYLINGDEMTERILPATRLRIRATYRRGEKSGAGGIQDADIDLRGLTALVPRIHQPSCGRPRTHR
jgi:hypothetical protein